MADSRNNPSADLPQLVAAVLRDHVHHRQSVVVGLSGGVDSVVMTHVLREVQPQLGFALSAVHVNHRLSPNADAWERFCVELCARLGIDLSVRQVDVVGIAGAGLEGAARRARYRAYADTRAHWIALAHHRDDQAETVLLNVLRGAGVRGAAGIPVVRALDASQPDGLRLIRPMLTVPRSDIAAYAAARGLAWIEDESNAAIRLGRNYLRHEILPRLAARFPAANARLAQAAAHFAEVQALLDELARQDLDAASHEGRLQVQALRTLGAPRARNLLRSMLSRHGIAMPDTVRLDEMLHQLTSAPRDAAVELPVGEHVLRRFRGAVYLTSPQADIPVASRPWRGETELAWGNGRILFEPVQGEGIDLSALTRGLVTIQGRRGGERFRPDARRPRRTLKNLLQEAQIPPWQRDGMPLLWCGGQLVWVPGIGVACDYRCPPGAAGVVVTWIEH
jgi:tRNA(Ile)-lysidine synthase